MQQSTNIQTKTHTRAQRERERDLWSYSSDQNATSFQEPRLPPEEERNGDAKNCRRLSIFFSAHGIRWCRKKLAWYSAYVQVPDQKRKIEQLRRGARLKNNLIKSALSWPAPNFTYGLNLWPKKLPWLWAKDLDLSNPTVGTKTLHILHFALIY